MNRLALLITLLLAGCASTVKKSGETPVTHVGSTTGRTVVLNLTGSAVSTTSKDWSDFKALWHEPCNRESAAIGDTLVMQDGEPKPTGEDGTLVVVDVEDYRYVSTATRIMLGIMTGNAFIKAHVSFQDLKSGDVRSTQTYDTTSTAWQGIFSGMTTKQVSAMCHEIFTAMAP